MGINGDAEGWSGDGLALVVDDDETIRSVTSRMLQNLGFSVLTAEDGREATEIFAKHANEIVVVVLDVVMPNMGGGEALHRMRQIRPDVSAVLMSGYRQKEVRQELAKGGTSVFISKPCGRNEFTSAIREVIKSASAA